MSFSNTFHILNPNKKNRPGVRRYFKKKPSDLYFWVERSSHPTHLETILEWALIRGHKKIAIWGGDGTLSRSVQALYEWGKLEEVQLVLVPAGTGNDFARRLGLGPWKSMVAHLGKNKLKESRFDVGLLGFESKERIFVNNAGFGRSADALKRKRANPIKDIFSFQEKKIQVEWSTEKIDHFESFRTFLAIVCNGPYFNKGMYFKRDVDPQDGILNAFLVPPMKRLRLFGKFLSSRLGGSLFDPSVIRLDSNFINIDSETLLYPQVDGEPASLSGTTSLRFSVLPGALRLLFPSSRGTQ